MRILTYNIHGCIGTDGLEKPDRIIEVLRDIDADVVALQEVHSSDLKENDFLESLHELPYQSAIYGKTMRKSEADYGNLMLLRQPPDAVQTLAYASSTNEPRGAIIVDTQIDGHATRLINTHLDLKYANRKNQILELSHYMNESPRCILSGDLNEWIPNRHTLRHIRSQFDVVSEHRTFPARFPLFGLDRIGLRGSFSKCEFTLYGGPLAKLASDHRPLICDLEI